jgi:hypothetical protein
MKLFGERNDYWGKCPSCNLNAYLKEHILCLTYLAQIYLFISELLIRPFNLLKNMANFKPKD